MLRKVRIILAAVFFVGITLLILGIGAGWWGWMAKLQFFPSVLRVIGSATLLNIGILAGLLALTFLFGRVYCSVICPLGVLQDLALRLRNLVGVKKKFSFKPELKVVRYGFLILTVASMIAGLQVIAALIAPYSAYGRIVRGICGIGNGGPLALILLGCGTFILIVALAVTGGRWWCGNVCPVGTFLGLISRFSIFKIRIDWSKCVGCGLCAANCKASCIDSRSGKIDASRCVGCFDCIGSCHVGALSFSARKSARPEARRTDVPEEGSGVSRRAFLATAAVLGTGAIAKAADKLQGGLAPIVPKSEPARKVEILPPGAWSVAAFSEACTSCQLCVSSCPNGVLKPSSSLESLLQPRLSYTDGWCRPECTECSDVCPFGAIRPITREEKTTIKIGTASVNAELCTSCGHCAKKCPSGAIRILKVGERLLPVVDEGKCLGCGACEYLCPVRPESAIMVSGLEKHVRI